MLICRDEAWGRVLLDPEDDGLWAELWSGAEDPRIDRILSATCRLAGALRARQRTKSVAETWIAIIERLAAAGVMRLNFIGAEEIRRTDALQIVRATLGRGLAATVSLEDCPPELERFPGFPLDMGLRVVFDPLKILRAERQGRPSLTRRIELIQQCVEKELRVTVLTPYEPFCPLTLTELGERLASAGVRDWQILEPGPELLHEPWHAAAGLEEVRQLRGFFRWMEISYRQPTGRENDLVVEADGTVQALESEEPRRYLKGSVDALVRGDLLTEAFFDRHARQWLGWTSPGDAPAVLTASEPALVPARLEVFLSYNHKDRDLANAFRGLLKSGGIDVWIDEEALQAGAQWPEVLGDALVRCRAVIFCIGPSGLGHFQRQEMNVALANETLVVPVLLPGSDPSGIPSMLRGYHWVDCRTSFTDPVAKLVRDLWRLMMEPERSEIEPPTAARGLRP